MEGAAVGPLPERIFFFFFSHLINVSFSAEIMQKVNLNGLKSALLEINTTYCGRESPGVFLCFQLAQLTPAYIVLGGVQCILA